jgi:glycosyltransferase involved in cell wall biosynthesis
MFFQPQRTRKSAVNGGANPARPRSIALMIESVYLGGAEMVVYQLALALRARGHVVHPVVPNNREGWLIEALRAEGFPVHRYDLRRPIDAGFPARLATLIAGLNVDVVHSHEFVMSVYGTAAARRLGVPHVITMHGNQGTTDKLQRRVALRWAIRHSRATVAVSRDTRQHFEARLGIRDGSLQVIPNGMPERSGDRDRIRTELGLSASEVLLLSVGNLSPRKAHHVLVSALTQLHESEPNLPWRLAIVGDGPERPRLEAAIQASGLEKRIHLLGTRTDVPDLQAAADVFVLPSLWEGLPLAILEAMFAGNAVIASNISGIPEAIEDGKQGLLTPPGDPTALAEAIAKVLRQPEYRLQLGAAALEHARNHFTIDVMTSAYERLYEHD